MGNLYVRGGTPTGSVSLCSTCEDAAEIRGYRESELVTVCTNVHPNLTLPFKVYSCSQYQDRSKPDWEQMEKLALVLEPEPLKKHGFRSAGFLANGDAEDED